MSRTTDDMVTARTSSDRITILNDLLTTTRSVRKRLDLTRPVDRAVLEECLAAAQQAPCESNSQRVHFVVVTNPDQRRALAEVFRRGFEIYKTLPGLGVYNARYDDPRQDASRPRIQASLEHLVEHLHDVPVHVIPCITSRTDNQPTVLQSAMWGSVVPATWSFMLAARSRGLGTCWTSLHLFFEEEAAALIGVPYGEVMQAALIPVAYTQGDTFKPAYRQPLENIVHWGHW